MVPQGWVDDGTTLKSPNNVPIVKGFRAWVLSHAWDSSNWALSPEEGMVQLEASNAALGGGTQQFFRKSMLAWTQAHDVFEEWVGVECQYNRKQYAGLWTQHQQDTAEITALQAQVAQLQAGQAQVVPDQVKTAAQYVMRYLGL